MSMHFAAPAIRRAVCSFVLIAAGCRTYDGGLIANDTGGGRTAGSAVRGTADSHDAAKGSDAPSAERDAGVSQAWTSELGDDAAAAVLDAGTADTGSAVSVAVSPACGNGKVDPDESCDVAIASGEPGACPSDCGAQTGCTHDALAGKACLVACVAVAVETLTPGDGCCPALPGANANTDSDCAPSCGNGVTEPGEQCDGDAGCNPDCTRPSETELACRAARGDDACARCECEHCAEQTIACVDSGETMSDKHCAAILDCGHEHHCTAIDCYCGNDSLLQCAVSAGGPCVAQIRAAAGTSDPTAIYEAQMRTDSAVGRAAALGSCAKSTCAAECGF